MSERTLPPAKSLVKYLLVPLAIFAFSLALRYAFFTGFILGDDVQELHASIFMMGNPPDLHDAFHIRFGVWLFNVAFFRLLGVSEFSFFLPTFLMSASLGVIGYFLMLFWGYGEKNSFVAGLFVASAPFEILIGVVRANDLIFSWFLALGLASFLMLEKRPVLQGALLAVFMWLAFYVKLWVVYLFPPIAIYYLFNFVRRGSWKGAASFATMSLALHCTMGIYFQSAGGMFFPFFEYHSATYPVEPGALMQVFSEYPRMLFIGSQFGTTFFGYVPYLLLALVSFKLVLLLARSRSKFARFDRLDVYLIAFYATFFLMLEFFPNTFVFDRYYSAPRIFRYLAPLSFPMTLHLAKMVLDIGKSGMFARKLGRGWPAAALAILIVVNIVQANDATMPGQSYKRALLSVVKDVESISPSNVIFESWIKFFMSEVYLKGRGYNILTVPNYTYDSPAKYEAWLQEITPSLKGRTVLVTGLCNYVHYGCGTCGFRLALFSKPLGPEWKLFSEYDLGYSNPPEPARVWIREA
jgi:hypothetical protein